MWHHFSVFDTLSILDPPFAYKHNTRDRWEQLVSAALSAIASAICYCCVCVCMLCVCVLRVFSVVIHSVSLIVRSFLFSFALLQLRLFLHLVDMI